MKSVNITFTAGGKGSCNHKSTALAVFEDDIMVECYSVSIDKKSLNQVLDYLSFIRNLSQDEWIEYRESMKELF